MPFVTFAAFYRWLHLTQVPIWHWFHWLHTIWRVETRRCVSPFPLKSSSKNCQRFDLANFAFLFTDSMVWFLFFVFPSSILHSVDSPSICNPKKPFPPKLSSYNKSGYKKILKWYSILGQKSPHEILSHHLKFNTFKINSHILFDPRST